MPAGAIRYNGEVFSALPGIWRTDYQGYFNDTTSWFDTAALKASPYNHNEAVSTINEADRVALSSVPQAGYCLASYTGRRRLYLGGDDGGWM
jgi:hypothetical protein